jgi:hypothetical protein
MSSNARCFGQDVVAAVGDLAQLLDRFVEVAALGGVPHGGAVQSAVEQLVLGGHAQAYRKKIRFTIVLAVTRGLPASRAASLREALPPRGRLASPSLLTGHWFLSAPKQVGANV